MINGPGHARQVYALCPAALRRRRMPLLPWPWGAGTPQEPGPGPDTKITVFSRSCYAVPGRGRTMPFRFRKSASCRPPSSLSPVRAGFGRGPAFAPFARQRQKERQKRAVMPRQPVQEGSEAVSRRAYCARGGKMFAADSCRARIIQRQRSSDAPLSEPTMSRSIGTSCASAGTASSSWKSKQRPIFTAPVCRRKRS